MLRTVLSWQNVVQETPFVAGITTGAILSILPSLPTFHSWSTFVLSSLFPGSHHIHSSAAVLVVALSVCLSVCLWTDCINTLALQPCKMQSRKCYLFSFQVNLKLNYKVIDLFPTLFLRFLVYISKSLCCGISCLLLLLWIY